MNVLLIGCSLLFAILMITGWQNSKTNRDLAYQNDLYGLQSFVKDPTQDKQIFCSRDLEVLKTHRVTFIGDSTMRTFFVALAYNFHKPPGTCFNAYTPNAERAWYIDQIPALAQIKDARETRVARTIGNLTLYQIYQSQFPQNPKEMRPFIRSMFGRLNETDIIVFGQALHLLHLYPDRQATNFYFLRNIKTIYRMALDLMPRSTKCVILPTSNPIAIQKFFGVWAELSTLYNEHDPKTLDDCFTKYQDFEVCANYMFTDKGVEHVNRIIREFVEEAQRPEGPKVVLLDVHHLFLNSKDHTVDGVHYQDMKNLAIALLNRVVKEECGIVL